MTSADSAVTAHRYDYDKKGSTGELATALARDCGPEVAHWLCTEMQQNRTKKLAKQKVAAPSCSLLPARRMLQGFLIHDHTRPSHNPLTSAAQHITSHHIISHHCATSYNTPTCTTALYNQICICAGSQLSPAKVNCRCCTPPRQCKRLLMAELLRHRD